MVLSFYCQDSPCIIFAVKLTESVVLLLSLPDPDVAEVLVLLLVVSDKGAAIVPDIPPVPLILKML